MRSMALRIRNDSRAGHLTLEQCRASDALTAYCATLLAKLAESVNALRDWGVRRYRSAGQCVARRALALSVSATRGRENQAPGAEESTKASWHLQYADSGSAPATTAKSRLADVTSPQAQRVAAYTTGASVRVRESASSSGKIIAGFPLHTALWVEDIDGEWARVLLRSARRLRSDVRHRELWVPRDPFTATWIDAATPEKADRI